MSTSSSAEIGGFVTPDGFGINLKFISKKNEDSEVYLARFVALISFTSRNVVLWNSLITFQARIIRQMEKTMKIWRGSYLCSLVMLRK